MYILVYVAYAIMVAWVVVLVTLSLPERELLYFWEFSHPYV